jgi:hypothetical protein
MPNDRANLGRASSGAVETFHPNRGWFRRFYKILEIVGDARSCAAVDQDIEGVRIEDGSRRPFLRHGRVRPSDASGDRRESKQCGALRASAMCLPGNAFGYVPVGL